MIHLSINKKIILFGFIFTFFSSFGQSFFLGLFNAPIRNELGITHGEFGNIYATATICSSLTLIWIGKKIDDYSLLYYALFVVLLLSLSSLLFSFINSIYFLALGIFLMRFSGQGLIGISNGLANVLGSSTWAEIYGVKYIGSIKALTTALMVFSTAFGTALFGILIDHGFTIENIALISVAYITASLILLLLFRKKLEPVKQK